MYENRFLIAAAVGLSLVCGALTAHSELKAGPVHIKPSLNVSSVYDDNVFLDVDNERDDYYYEILPQFEFWLPINSSCLNLNYAYQILRFQDFTNENDENHWLDFDGIIDLGRRFNLKISDHYRQQSDPVIIDITNRVTRKTNVADIRGIYDFNDKLAMLLGYNNTDYDYERPLIDRSQDEYLLDIYWRLWPQVSVTAGYVRGEIDIKDTSQDAAFNRYCVGVRGQISPKLRAEARFGTEQRDYEHPARENLQKLYLSGTGSYRVSDTMLIQLEAERGISEAASIEHNAYIYQGVQAGVEKWLTEKVKVNLWSRYHEADFELRVVTDSRGPRKDELWLLGADMSYHLKNFVSIDFGYESQINDSNFKEMDYERNTIKAAVNLLF